MGAIQKSQFGPHFSRPGAGLQAKRETAAVRDLAQDGDPHIRGARACARKVLLKEENRPSEASPPSCWMPGAVRDGVANDPVGASASAAGALARNFLREPDDADGRFPGASTDHVSWGGWGDMGELAAESMRELDKSNISAQGALTGIICDL